MNSSGLQLRLKEFAYCVVNVCEQLPQKKVAAVIEHRVLRSSFSDAANYRTSSKAISRKAFVVKLSIPFEEIDESLFWLEAINELQLHPAKKMTSIIQETTDLASILASSRKTAKAKPTIKS
jgi:four helix bundle protein